MSPSRLATIIGSVLVLTGGLAAQTIPVPGRGQAPAELNALAKDFREARDAFTRGGDFSRPVVERAAAQLKTFRSRLDGLPHAAWPVADRVDWYTLLSEMNELDFRFRVLRPWSRDPGMYVGLAFPRRGRGALVEQTDPDVIDADEVKPLTDALHGVPAALDRAKTYLTEPTKNHADLAVRMIEHRNSPGTHYRYTTTLEKLERLERVTKAKHPELSAAARTAADALVAYAKWLRDGRDKMAPGGHIGLDNYTWYLQTCCCPPTRRTRC